MCGCKGKCGCNIVSTTKGEKGDASPVASLGYKVYTAILDQSSTSAPVATVLQNTLGVITYSYAGVGNYLINSSALFTVGKTWLYLKDNDGNQLGTFAIVRQDDDSMLEIFAFSDYMTSPSNNVLNAMSFEIRVYP